MEFSIRQFYEGRLFALDGRIGHVKDFYFDDRKWVVRYVVADTGPWLRGRQVLISPRALGELDAEKNALSVNLNRSEIEKCPLADTHKPLSRRYEEEYHQYYGWPYYWDGNALWGMSGFPVLSQQTRPFLGDQIQPVKGNQGVDAHLRSAQTVMGYGIQTNGETVGHVADFFVDGQTWKILHLIVAGGRWFSGNQFLISPEQVKRISWDDSLIILDLSKGEIHKGQCTTKH